MEESIKPLNTENEESFTPITNIPQETPQTEQKNEVIKELPTWNIEPPVEVKRGI